MSDIFRRISNEIPKLRRYAQRLARDQSEVDDLVQDALARALSRVHLWQDGTDLRAWLFAILHNHHLNLVRRAGRAGDCVALDDREMPLQVAPVQLTRLWLRDLHRALDQLPAKQRELVILAGFEELNYSEMARIVAAPVGTIRSRLSRGRDTLRALMGEGESEEHGQRGSYNRQNTGCAPACASLPHPTPPPDAEAGRQSQ